MMADLIQKYPTEAQLLMAALEDGLTLGPMRVMETDGIPGWVPRVPRDAPQGDPAGDGGERRHGSGALVGNAMGAAVDVHRVAAQEADQRQAGVLGQLHG